MGTLTDYEGDAVAALAHYRRAVAVRPASVDARVALAMGLLRCDHLQEGFSIGPPECLAGEYRRASSAPAWRRAAPEWPTHSPADLEFSAT